MSEFEDGIVSGALARAAGQWDDRGRLGELYFVDDEGRRYWKREDVAPDGRPCAVITVQYRDQNGALAEHVNELPGVRLVALGVAK